MPAFIMGDLPIFQQPAVVDLFADSFYEHPKKRHQRQLLAASRHTAQQVAMERESKQQQTEGEGATQPASPTAASRQLLPPPVVEEVPLDKEFLEHKARQEAALAAQAAMAKQAGKGEVVNIVLPKEPNTLTPALSLVHKAIAKTLGEQYDAVSSVFDHSEVVRVKRMETLMSESLDHVNIFPAGQQSEAELDRFMFAFMRRIRALNIADALIVPVGFAASVVGQPAQTLLLVVDRKDQEHFRVGVVNNTEGEGLEYHATNASFSPAIKHRMVFTVDDIPVVRLTDSSFWFVLFQYQCWPLSPEQKGSRILYEQLIPYLNNKPLYNNLEEQLTAEGTTATHDLCEWRALPRNGDHSRVRVVLETVFYTLRVLGIPRLKAKYFTSVLIKWSICRMLLYDLNLVTGLSGSDRLMVQLMCANLARSAGKQTIFPHSFGNPALVPVIGSKQLQSVKDSIAEIDAKVKRVYQDPNVIATQENEHGEEVDIMEQINKAKWMPYPLFDKFKKEDVDHLIGPAKVPPILRPIQLTLVPDHVVTCDDVGLALRHCDHVCTLMAYQTDTIKNTYALRVALIQHLFTQVIPIPLPMDHPRKAQDMWMQPMRYETQLDILRSINLIGRHFASSALSVKVTRSFDASRILTMACMAAIADAILRVKACDVPSLFCLHYNGQMPGPLHPFGFECGDFAVQSEVMQFTNPELVTCRTQVLDYFTQQRLYLRDDHIIFPFERHMQIGNAEKLLDQVALEIGFQRGSNPMGQKGEDKDYLPLYFSGEQPAFIDFYPELAVFRDIIFIFKFMMTPSQEALPEIKRWNYQDARLQWRYAPDEKKGGKYKVEAFGRRLKPYSMIPPGEEKKQTGEGGQAMIGSGDGEGGEGKKEGGGFFGIVSRFFGKNSRAPASAADPSILAGEKIENEDDVLHVKQLPDFGNRVNPRGSELLLSYLTAPYLRIPLVLSFFANQGRLTSLGSEKLRALLDGVLFEPGQWQSINMSQKPLPDTIPYDRSYLATPTGLLFNELIMSPEGVLQSLRNMLNLALDLDTGRWSTANSPVILYIVRLIVRVEDYILFIVHHWHFVQSDGITTGGWQSHVRGLLSNEDNARLLHDSQKKMRAQLDTGVFPMLERWCQLVTRANDISTACVLHAHMAYMYKNVQGHELTRPIVTTILAAQVFLTTRYVYDIDVKPGEVNQRKKLKQERDDEDEGDLGIPDTEIFDLFQKQRWKVLRWLKNDPPQGKQQQSHLPA